MLSILLRQRFSWIHDFPCYLYDSLLSFDRAPVSRKPCLKALSYPAPASTGPHDALGKLPGLPIRLADKLKCCCCIKNVFTNHQRFPDQSDEFDTLLHNINGGSVLRKLKHPPPMLDVVDPSFSFSFGKALHGKTLRRNLDLSHLDTALQDTIYAMIRKYWAVFDNRGVFVPVKNYKCVINTGDSPPIVQLSNWLHLVVVNVAVMRSACTLISGKGIRRLGHQQESAHALWTTICLGYGLLCHPVHNFVQ